MSESWIDSVLDECSHVETPRPWIWWSLVGAVSAVSANYYLRTLRGAVLYKPNLYIMLLGKSGLGKGFGINLAKLLVMKADVTRVVAGRSSIQAIVSELSKQKSRPDGKAAILDSRGFVINGELASAVISDVDALSILTDLYDGHYNPEWDNLLKVSGREKLKSPYIVTLFGSSPEHFYDKIPAANIAGGYIARNLMVFEEKRFQDVDLLDDHLDETTDDLVNGYIVPKYSEHLEKISKGGGRISYSEASGKLFNTWRKQWRTNQVDDKTGFGNRVPDHVLKVAMCLTLARYDNDKQINESDMSIAIEKVVHLTYSNKLAGSGRSVEPLANHSKTVVDLLLRAEDNQLRRKLLLTRCYPFGLCETSVLDKITDALVEMNWITRERVGTGSNSDWLFKLSGEPLEEYLKWKQSNQKK